MSYRGMARNKKENNKADKVEKEKEKMRAKLHPKLIPLPPPLPGRRRKEIMQGTDWKWMDIPWLVPSMLVRKRPDDVGLIGG